MHFYRVHKDFKHVQFWKINFNSKNKNVSLFIVIFNVFLFQNNTIFFVILGLHWLILSNLGEIS